jgi:hypothetical protein
LPGKNNFGFGVNKSYLNYILLSTRLKDIIELRPGRKREMGLLRADGDVETSA